MSYSSDFKINVNKLNANEALLVCLEISHPFISDTIRLVNDSKNLISNGNDYISMPFDVARQSDIQGELPRVSLKIPNVGKNLVKWIDSSGGGKDAVIRIKLIRRSNPNTSEETLTLGINNVSINTLEVVFNLIIQNNLTKQAVRYIFDKKRAIGLF